MMETLSPPEPTTTLDPGVLGDVPRDRGLYAAWMVDAQALAEAGVAGPPPRLVYLGIAAGEGGLRRRLARHAGSPFWDLVDLLAARGTIIPGWWHYARKNQPYRRSLHPPPLAKLASDEALAWQHKNLRWGWTTMSSPAAYESELIAAHQPLLNVSGKGFSVLGPPQLRYVGDWEPRRAAWLFSVVWIAVLCERPEGWIRHRWRERSEEIRVDDDGWPTASADLGDARKIRIPREHDAQMLLLGCLPEGCRDVTFNDDAEALTWWAAYAGLTLGSAPQAIEDILWLAASRRVDAIRTPRTLPVDSRRREMIDVVRLLPGVLH